MSEPVLEEEKRLQAVRALGLLDQPEEERFHRIARLARRHFRAGTCAITLIDQERAFFVAKTGEDRSEQSKRNDSLCAHVVAGKDPVIVADHSSEALDPIYQNLVEKLGLKFYAGVPILSPEGYAVGALCVMDHIPRRFDRRDLESLADFAAIVEDEMMFKKATAERSDLVSKVEKLRFRAFVDPLTNVWNRGAIFDILQREVERARRSQHDLSVCMLDLDHFKRINDTYGHQAGDEVLKETCVRIRSGVRPYDGIGRYGGEEFLIVYPETTAEQAEGQAERIRIAIASKTFDVGDQKTEIITASLGVAHFHPGEDVKELIARADTALYKAKAEGRNKVVLGLRDS